MVSIAIAQVYSLNCLLRTKTVFFYEPQSVRTQVSVTDRKEENMLHYSKIQSIQVEPIFHGLSSILQFLHS